MDKNQTQTDELTKSIDSLIDDVFSEPVQKGENFEVASASKTTADAAVNAAPASQDDASRGAGRPKQISDVPKNDEDGKRDGQYDASIASKQGEEENPEAKQQSKSIDQNSSAGRVSQAPAMRDPRLSKSVEMTEEEAAQFEEFKKSQAAAAEQKKNDEIKKADDIKKAQFQDLIKSEIEKAIGPLKTQNDELKKSLEKSETLVKAMAAQPVRAKSVTGIEALEKSQPENQGPQEFTKSEKLDAAEALVKANKLPMEAVIELENTGTIYNPAHRQLIEAQLQKNN